MKDFTVQAEVLASWAGRVHSPNALLDDLTRISGGSMKLWRQPLDKDRIRVPQGIIHVIEERCKGCGFCVEFCPREVFVISKRTNLKGYHPPEITDSSQCADCGLCALLCPDFAIYVESEQTPSDAGGETE